MDHAQRGSAPRELQQDPSASHRRGKEEGETDARPAGAGRPPPGHRPRAAAAPQAEGHPPGLLRARSERPPCQPAQRAEDDVRAEEGRRLPRELPVRLAARAVHDEDAPRLRVRRRAHLHAEGDAGHDLREVERAVDHRLERARHLVHSRAAMKKIAFALLLSTLPLFAADSPDLTMQTRIRQEGFRNSKVMEIASGLMDYVGPRLTGSPNMKRANEWTRDKLTGLGLSNAHLEQWGPFGRGWSYESCSVRLVSPDVAQFWALPRAWAPGTNGPVRGTPVKIKIEKVEDIDKYKGKLAGKIVLNGDAR